MQYLLSLPVIAAARAARLPDSGPVPAAAGPHARRRLLRRARRQHPGGAGGRRGLAVCARPTIRRSRSSIRFRARSGCCFSALTVLFTYTSREVVRDLLLRRWRAGIGLKRVLVVGSGDLGRMVADRILDHSELGFKLVGFVDDQAAASDAIGYRGLPVLGPISDTPQVCQQRAGRRHLRGAAARRAPEDARRGRVRQPRVHQRARRAGPAAVHRAARPARRPRRPAAHQHQRRAAARASTASSSGITDIALSAGRARRRRDSGG